MKICLLTLKLCGNKLHLVRIWLQFVPSFHFALMESGVMQFLHLKSDCDLILSYKNTRIPKKLEKDGQAKWVIYGSAILQDLLISLPPCDASRDFNIRKPWRGSTLSKASRPKRQAFFQQNICSCVGLTKSRAFALKSCQNTSSSVGMTKSRAFAWKSCQNISTSVGITKTRANICKIFLL